jgi:hypothetical protein
MRRAILSGALLATVIATPLVTAAQLSRNAALPDAPGIATTAQLNGSVLDANGNSLPSAIVVVEEAAAGTKVAVKPDGDGDFNFPALKPGVYRLKISAEGFASPAPAVIVLQAGEVRELPPITLSIETVDTSVNAVLAPHDLAEVQLHQEEQQRIFGVIPNFYIVYDRNPAPLDARQKFQLAWRSMIDPVTFLSVGVTAGIEQSQNDFDGYGQGGLGYAKRYAATYGDNLIGTAIGGAILPAVLHQDPRYYYKGHGSVRSRFFYAVSTVFICKGDNGKWEPNYSNVLGAFAGGGISNAYYPASDRHGLETTFNNTMIGFGSSAINSVIQEFFLHRFTKGAPKVTGQETP